MRKLLTYQVLICLFLLPSILWGQQKRPKIGYAFGGGGAKGIAEIGVLRVLEEAGIRPDYITGTSIGSIVGGLENGKIKLPGGFVQGQKVGLLLSQLTLPAHGVDDFDDFDIPFRCVAADFETGEPVVLGSGSLAKAIRASMSIPSVFEPIEIDGRLLIDGGVVRNLPVQEVKEMGADIIIAIDVTSPLYKKDELTSFV